MISAHFYASSPLGPTVHGSLFEAPPVSHQTLSPGVIGEHPKDLKEPRDLGSSLLSRSGGSFSLFGGDSIYCDCLSEASLSGRSFFSSSGGAMSPSLVRGYSSPILNTSTNLPDAMSEEEQSGDDASGSKRGLSRRRSKAASTLDLMVPTLQISPAPVAGESPPENPDLNRSQGSDTRPRCGRPDGKFPLCLEGRCQHRDHWSRLRGKRGHAYFFCRYCGLGWRVPRPKTTSAGQEDHAEPADPYAEEDSLGDSMSSNWSSCSNSLGASA